MFCQDDAKKGVKALPLKRNPKKNRLRNRKDFFEVVSCGKKIYGSVVNFNVLNDNRCRLGITVSKKSGNAVFRNRLKRVIRMVYLAKQRAHEELFQTISINVCAIPNSDIELSLTPSALIEQDFEKMLKKLVS